MQSELTSSSSISLLNHKSSFSHNSLLPTITIRGINCPTASGSKGSPRTIFPSRFCQSPWLIDPRKSTPSTSSPSGRTTTPLLPASQPNHFSLPSPHLKKNRRWPDWQNNNLASLFAHFAFHTRSWRRKKNSLGTSIGQAACMVGTREGAVVHSLYQSHSKKITPKDLILEYF